MDPIKRTTEGHVDFRSGEPDATPTAEQQAVTSPAGEPQLTPLEQQPDQPDLDAIAEPQQGAAAAPTHSESDAPVAPGAADTHAATSAQPGGFVQDYRDANLSALESQIGPKNAA